jgi:hypothetical protein
VRAITHLEPHSRKQSTWAVAVQKTLGRHLVCSCIGVHKLNATAQVLEQLLVTSAEVAQHLFCCLLQSQGPAACAQTLEAQRASTRLKVIRGRSVAHKEAVPANVLKQCNAACAPKEAPIILKDSPPQTSHHVRHFSAPANSMNAGRQGFGVACHFCQNLREVLPRRRCILAREAWRKA